MQLRLLILQLIKMKQTKAANSLKGLDKEIKAVNRTITEQQDNLTKVTAQIQPNIIMPLINKKNIFTLEAALKQRQMVNCFYLLNKIQKELSESLVDTDREIWQKRIEGVKQYAQAISDVYSGISAIYEGDMTNKKFDAEKWEIEESRQKIIKKEKNFFMN